MNKSEKQTVDSPVAVFFRRVKTRGKILGSRTMTKIFSRSQCETSLDFAVTSYATVLYYKYLDMVWHGKITYMYHDGYGTSPIPAVRTIYREVATKLAMPGKDTIKSAFFRNEVILTLVFAQRRL